MVKGTQHYYNMLSIYENRHPSIQNEDPKNFML
jgi:hypothetical protein